MALVVTLPAVSPEAVPVMFVPTSADGVPSAGVTKVGLVANTAAPVPVSSVNAPASWAEVNEPSDVALPAEVTAPVRLALVVTVAALPVVFWFSVGMSVATIARNVGAPAEPLGAAST